MEKHPTCHYCNPENYTTDICEFHANLFNSLDQITASAITKGKFDKFFMPKDPYIKYKNIIAGLLFVIDWLGDYVEFPDDHEDHVRYLYNTKWKGEILPAMKEAIHWGDCTKSCMTCLVCMVEQLHKQADKLIESDLLEFEED